MRKVRSLLNSILFGALIACAGCNTVTRGTTQKVTVLSEPSGADCAVEQGSRAVGTVSPTPGVLEVDRSMDNLRVTCSKMGYQSASVTKTAMRTQMLGGASALIDMASGANNSYPPNIRVILLPVAASSSNNQ